MAKYRKKPLAVDAVQWFPGNEPPKGAQIRKDKICNGSDHSIKTLEGWVDLRPGSWIVGPGVAGEFWPVDDGVFRQTYEREHISDTMHLCPKCGCRPIACDFCHSSWEGCPECGCGKAKGNRER